MNLNTNCKKIYTACFLCLLIMFMTSRSFAQTPPDVPASTDPSRFQQQLPPARQQQQKLQAPPVEGQQQYSTAVPEGADSYRFILNRLSIEGSTIWSPEELEAISAPMIGREISVADIYALSDELTRKYQNAGYFLSRALVPQQEIDGGIVKIAVVEGYLQDITFDASESGYPKRFTEEIKRRLVAKRPLNIRDLEFQLLALDNVPGCDASSVLLPLDPLEAQQYPGGVRLSLNLRCHQDIYTANLDNYGSKYVGPWQYGIRSTMAHGGLFPGTFSTGLFLSPQIEELRYVSLEERAHISPSGLIFKSGFQSSWSEPGSDLGIIDLYSRLLSVSVGIEYPIWLSRAGRLQLDADLTYKNVSSDIISTRFYDDRLRGVRTGLSYEKSFKTGLFASVAANYSKGLNILGARETGSDDLSREEGKSDFSKIDFSANIFQPLPYSFGLGLNIKGQYANVALLSSEEFGYGGYTLGRAYDNSEITGDSGIGGLLELTWNRHAAYQGRWNAPSIQPFVYIDSGKVWNEDNGGAIESGVSAGGGVRLGWGEKAQISATIAQPLTRSIENPSYGNGHNPRFLISTSLSF